MTREQIIEVCRVGRERASAHDFAQTPPNPKHAKRLEELKSATYQRLNFGPELS